MNEKKCPTCGSNMGLGAVTAENVKAVYECWCGEVVIENYAEEEIPAVLVDSFQTAKMQTAL